MSFIPLEPLSRSRDIGVCVPGLILVHIQEIPNGAKLYLHFW